MTSKLVLSLLWRAVCCLWVTWVAMPVHVRGDAMKAQACDSKTSNSCSAMVGYKASANFDLFQIASRFNVSKELVLGANDIDPSLWNGSELVLPPQNKPYLIPQKCGCQGGTRIVTWLNYTVVAGDTLSAIASKFLGLVTYTEIANVSGISNPDLILPDQHIVIPVPCACFNYTSALSLSYQIQRGDSLSSIAQLYKTSAEQLQDLNTLADNTELEESKLLFVPLPVCKANFSSGAMDGNLTVVEGAFELTANDCVQCNCNNGTLHCIPAPPLSGRTCSNLTCSSSGLVLGASNTSQGSQDCSVESCVYKGYSTQTGIISSLVVEQDLTCPAAPPPETFYKPPTGLVAAPMDSPPASSSTSSSSPPPSTSVANPPSTTNNPNSVAPTFGGIDFFARWCLLILGVLL